MAAYLIADLTITDPDGFRAYQQRVGATLAPYGGTFLVRGGGLFAVWTDTRNAATCPAVDAYRAGTASKPDVITSCPTTFGNTDIYLGIVS